MADRQKPHFSKEMWGFLFTVMSIVAILIVFSSCTKSPISRTVRLYDMDKGTTIEAFINDARQVHGEITAKNKVSGEVFVGEYNSIRDDVARTSSSLGGAFGSNLGSVGPYALSQSGYSWATALGFSFEERNKIYGAATMIGDRKTIIEAVYAVDRQSLHGYGVARDNIGTFYKLHF
jgi:hypothetical protein